MQTILRSSLPLFALLGACAPADAGSSAGSLARTESALSQPPRCNETDAAPAPGPDACLFGEVFSDIRTNDALQQPLSEVWIRSATELDALTGEQLLRAVQQSSHTDVTTPAEALARVDQQEVRRIDFSELASGREFVVFEYGVGDNSYGAFFEREGDEVVASIHDGDLLDCTVRATR